MESNGKNGQTRSRRSKRSTDSELAQVDGSVTKATEGGKPLVDSAVVRRTQRGSARPSGFIPQDVSDLWSGSDVSHLRRNILT
jgi:hypothetical protein